MSYKRHFSKDFKIPLDISITDPIYHTNSEGKYSHLSFGRVRINLNGDSYDFPIGGDGSSESHNLSHQETVDVDIEVDTSPFDQSIDDCNKHVNALTGSVAATETAQVASINENSKKVAKTIITGFFKNVQADISSQIMQLSQKVDSRLMHLREQAKTLQAKRAQMENDYQRTRARYIKIIEDLNMELEHRVRALDEPIFNMVSSVEEESDRMINADFAEIASVIAKENTALSAQIGAAMTKRRARQAISQASEFLRIQRLTDLTIEKGTISEIRADEGEFFLPVCYFEANEAGSVVMHNCAYDTDHLPKDLEDKVNDEIFSNPDLVVAMQPIDRENIEKFFKANVQEAFQASTTPHDIRVTNTISKLFFE